MPAKIVDTLIRFAKSRELAYRAAGNMTAPKMTACSKIMQVANFFKGKNEQQQLIAVRQLKDHLTTILPHEKSRFHKQRKQIIDLMEQCHD